MLWFGLAPWVIGLDLILCIGVVLLVELEYFGWSTTVLIASLVASHFLHVFSIVDVIKHHLGQTMLYILYYFLIGAGWAVFKWCLFLLKFRERRSEVLAEFHNLQEAARDRIAKREPGILGQRQDNDDRLVEETDAAYLSYQSYKVTPLNRAPKIRHYKSKFSAWMSLWVFSMIGTLFHDIVHRISMWFYNRISGALQWISDKMVGDVVDPPSDNP